MNAPEELPFDLTAHARQVVTERGIALAWVARVLSAPERTEPDSADADLHHALGSIPEHGGRVLRVVYNRTTSPWRIVTAYFDRRERRKA
jgi:hypothetical protein